jgi:sulfopyruvate decarboxylase subunit beta
MRRYEALREIMKAITDEPVICNLGHPVQELFSLSDRPQNFYMLGSMGLATSIAHGLALCQDKKIVVIDGDASVT